MPTPFQTTCSATPGCVAQWVAPASGTVITDVQPSPANLTLGAQGSISSTPVISEDTNSIAGSGAAGIAASCNVSGVLNSKLRIDGSTGLTVGIWLSSGTPASGAGIIGRTNNWRISQTGTNGQAFGVIYLGGVARTITAKNTWLSGHSGLLYMTWDTVYLTMWLNATIVQRQFYPYAAITQTTDTMEVMSVNGSSYPGTGLPAFVFNRPLSAGEGREFLRIGDPGRTIEVYVGGEPTLPDIDLVSDFHSDGVTPNPVLQASAQDRYCGFDGGLMRHNEGVIDGNDAFHPTCHVAAQATKNMALNSSLTAGTNAQIFAKYAARTVNIFNEWTLGMGKAPLSTWNNFEDNTGAWQSGGPYLTQIQVIMGYAWGAAVMHRYLGHNGPSPWLNIARNVLSFALTKIDPVTGSFTPGGGAQNNFAQCELGTIMIMLKGCVDQKTWDGYLDNYLKLVNYEWSKTAAFTATQGNANQVDSTNYANGNRCLQVAIGFYQAWMLTGNPAYQTEFETQFQFLLDPSVQFGSAAFGNATGDGSLHGGAFAGLYQYGGIANASTGAGYPSSYNITTGGVPGPWVGSDVRIPAASLLGMNPATDMAYFTECQTAAGNGNPGPHADNTHAYWGLDTGYAGYQADLAQRLWLLSCIQLGGNGDARFLQLMNLLRNTIMNRTNISTVTTDGTGNSRHQSPSAYDLLCDHALFFKLGLSDSRFSTAVTDMASMWNNSSNGFEMASRIDALNGSSLLGNGFVRWAGSVTQILWMQPSFPLPNLVKGA